MMASHTIVIASRHLLTTSQCCVTASRLTSPTQANLSCLSNSSAFSSIGESQSSGAGISLGGWKPGMVFRPSGCLYAGLFGICMDQSAEFRFLLEFQKLDGRYRFEL
eukprot:1572771-Rhodomonas_salina.2